MATKSILKNKKFDKTTLASKLDKLSHNVAKRGVFVVRENKYGEYDIFDYVNGVVYYDQFPNRRLAQQLCDTFNKNKKLQFEKNKRIVDLCKQISKHNTDCKFYMYTLSTTEDSVKREYTEVRLFESQSIMKHLLKDLGAVL